MWPFARKEERATFEEILLQSGVLTSAVSIHQALNIPALTACVELISMTVASLPYKAVFRIRRNNPNEKTHAQTY